MQLRQIQLADDRPDVTRAMLARQQFVQRSSDQLALPALRLLESKTGARVLDPVQWRRLAPVDALSKKRWLCGPFHGDSRSQIKVYTKS